MRGEEMELVMPESEQREQERREREDRRERERDEREMRRVEAQTAALDTRLRHLENEIRQLASLLDKEQTMLRQTLVLHKEAIEKNSLALHGDGTDQREGLVNWKFNMDRQINRMRTQVFGVIGAVGTVLLKFLGDFLNHLLK